jgi:formate dehydrogenase maturation protein FdhE
MPQPRRFDPTTPPPVGQRRCPACGVPMIAIMIEPTEQADDGQRTFECWTCSYSETVVLTSSGALDRSRA